jgi:aromatic ring-cleaving dioxygenase
MANPLRQLAEIFHYHVHVYYDDSTRANALLLREQIGERFAVQIGRLFETPVGPHPMAQYEIGLLQNEFARLVPWLMLNHHGLSILLHPNTDLEREDHAGSAMWLGEPLPLLLEKLDLSLIASCHQAPRAVTINSQISIDPQQV